MHELSIALSLVEVATEEACRRGAARVNAVHLKLGPLSGVVEEALRSAWELAREQTPLAEARLVIDAVPLTAFCPACQAPRAIASIQQMRCGQCNTLAAEVITGRELELTAMEIVE